MKKKALHLYLESLGFRFIGKFLGVSNVFVLNWIRSFARMKRKTKCYSKTVEMLKLFILLRMHYRNKTLYILKKNTYIQTNQIMVIGKKQLFSADLKYFITLCGIERKTFFNCYKKNTTDSLCKEL
jgi:hypothetical protein